MNPLWSYALTALGVLGLLLAGSRKRVGWALGLAAQPLWIAYAVATGQWGFILSGLVYGGVYLRNWLKWRREAERVMVAPAWRTHREMARYTPGRYPPTATNPFLIGGGQQQVASAVKPARSRPTPPPPDTGIPAPLAAPPPPPPEPGAAYPPPAVYYDPPRCDPVTGYHSTPHRGCTLR